MLAILLLITSLTLMSNTVSAVDTECKACQDFLTKYFSNVFSSDNVALQLDAFQQHTCLFLNDPKCTEKVNLYWNNTLQAVMKDNLPDICQILVDENVQCQDWDAEQITCPLCVQRLAHFSLLLGNRVLMNNLLASALVKCNGIADCESMVKEFLEFGLFSLNFASFFNRNALCTQVFGLQDCIQI